MGFLTSVIGVLDYNTGFLTLHGGLGLGVAAVEMEFGPIKYPPTVALVFGFGFGKSAPMLRLGSYGRVAVRAG